jgi:MFS transporter, OFA family, oxalate/formate antiporter
MHVARRWPLAEMQRAFCNFIATEAWLTPAAGAIVDRFGPRRGPSLMIAAGGVLVGPGWVINAYADTLPYYILAPRSPAPAPARSMPPASATR